MKKLQIKKETIQLMGEKAKYFSGGNQEQASTLILPLVSKFIRDTPTTGNADEICGPENLEAT